MGGVGRGDQVNTSLKSVYQGSASLAWRSGHLADRAQACIWNGNYVYQCKQSVLKNPFFVF